MATGLIDSLTGWSALHAVRKRTVLVGLFVLGSIVCFGASKAQSGRALHETIESIGLVLILVCIFGRTWCAIYVGGKKDGELVTIGPYSVCRNPLYVFSVLGAAGVGAQVGSVLVALFCAVFIWFVHYLAVIEEEAALAKKFGAQYEKYRARVPRFLANPYLWHGPDVIEVRVSNVVRTFLDASIFLLAVPWAETFEYLQNTGRIPILFHII